MDKYLGTHVNSLLSDSPFSEWEYERSVEKDLDRPAVLYVFKNKGLEIRCSEDEKVESIFCIAGEFDDSLIEYSFSQRRGQLLAALGDPEKSGLKMEDPILGNYGAWDRFRKDEIVIHFQYTFENDEIEKITYMLRSVAP